MQSLPFITSRYNLTWCGINPLQPVPLNLENVQVHSFNQCEKSSLKPWHVEMWRVCVHVWFAHLSFNMYPCVKSLSETRSCSVLLFTPDYSSHCLWTLCDSITLLPDLWTQSFINTHTPFWFQMFCFEKKQQFVEFFIPGHTNQLWQLSRSLTSLNIF